MRRPSSDARGALRAGPTTVWFSGWPWRAGAYLFSSLPVAVVFLGGVSVTLAVGTVLVVIGIGLAVLAYVPFAAVPLARVERSRLHLLGGPTLPLPAPIDRARPRRQRLRAAHRDPATWRWLAYGALMLPLAVLELTTLLVLLGMPVLLLGLPWWTTLAQQNDSQVFLGGPIDDPGVAWGFAVVGVPWLLAMPYGLVGAAALRASITRSLLLPRETVQELSRSRSRLVDSYEAERRRLERDLHDGAQQHLTSVIMTLGAARLELEDGPGHELVRRAHGQARTALAELRDLVHGLHPAVLADRGLAGALPTAAQRCTLPVDVDVVLVHRPPDAVEATAYFVACEALANADRHSGAARVRVSARRVQDTLVVEICDDGRGGAAPAGGSGLLGLADRVAVAGGRLLVTSPPGGPTLVRAELPCDW